MGSKTKRMTKRKQTATGELKRELEIGPQTSTATSTATSVGWAYSTTSGSILKIPDQQAPPSGKASTLSSTLTNRQIEAAVYAHLRAMRALGETKVETAKIAESLSLPVSV